MFAKIQDKALTAYAAGGATVTVIVSGVGLTNSGANITWESSDFTKFSDAGSSVTHNAAQMLDLLPYMILAGAVMFLIAKVTGIFNVFGGGKSGGKK